MPMSHEKEEGSIILQLIVQYSRGPHKRGLAPRLKLACTCISKNGPRPLPRLVFETAEGKLLVLTGQRLKAIVVAS